MRDISLNEPPSKLPVFSWLLYGPTRSGKTHWAAGLPRPLIIADIAESGWKTVKSMDRSMWFEPDHEPIVIGIDQMNDVAKLCETGGRIDQLIANGKVRSIVFDAFTYYADYFLAHLFRVQTKPDNRAAYGDLGKHLREVRTIIGNKGINVAYCCLEKPSDQDDPKGGPQIPGNQAGKFAGGVDFLWHATYRQIIEAGKVVGSSHEMHTRQHGTFIAGHRLGIDADLLPNPFTGTYSELLTCLGYDVELLRKSIATRVVVPTARPVVAPVARPTAPVARPITPAARPALPNNNPAPKVNSPQAK